MITIELMVSETKDNHVGFSMHCRAGVASELEAHTVKELMAHIKRFTPEGLKNMRVIIDTEAKQKGEN